MSMNQKKNYNEDFFHVDMTTINQLIF